MGAPPISFCAMGGTPIHGWPAAEAARAEPECARFRGSQSERSTSRVMSGRSRTAGRCSGGPALPAGGRSIPPGWASTTRGPRRHLGQAAPTGHRSAAGAVPAHRSARLVGPRDIPDLLPGRSETVELSPLSQGEIDQRSDSFIDAVFQDGMEVGVPPSDLRRDDYVERAPARRLPRGGAPQRPRPSRPLLRVVHL